MELLYINSHLTIEHTSTTHDVEPPVQEINQLQTPTRVFAESTLRRQKKAYKVVLRFWGPLRP